MTRSPIPGVELHALKTHTDSRGSVTEMFRAQWPQVPAVVQWNASHSQANVLRGVHVHRRHADYLIAVSGRMQIGLSDLRGGHARNGCIVELDAERMCALVIPPGVAHGFYFAHAAVHVYAVTHYWDPADELGCRWDDPALEIPWPPIEPQLSPRDQALGSLHTLLGRLAG